MPSTYLPETHYGFSAIRIAKSAGAAPVDLIHSEEMPPVPAAFQRWRIGGFGPHQFVSDYWLNEYDKNPSMDHLVITMELVFGEDKSLLVATKPITVTSEMLGTSYSYLGILESFPTIDFNVTMGSSASSSRSFSVSIPNEYIDALKLVRAGRILAGLGEISIQVDGGDYDERYVVMRGSMDSGVTFGDTDGEMVEVSLVDPKEILSMDLPPYKVPDLWPHTGDQAYPFHFRRVFRGMVTAAGISIRSTTDGYSGRAYPPAAGVGRTYPIVWGHWEKVPCVPLVRDPHASSSEFGSDADDEYKNFWGWDDDQDVSSWWVVAYGHGHRFADPLSASNDRIYLTVPQLEKSFEDATGVSWHDANGTESTGSTGGYYPRFFIWDGEDSKWSWSSTSTFGRTAALLEIADPNGTPITVLSMSSKEEPFDYGESITIPMISSLGSSVDPSVGSIWDSHSIINCVRFFARSFTTLGEIGIDDSLFAKAEARLGSLSVRGLVNGSGEASQAQTVTWIENELLKGFPMVSMTFTGQGYGPVVVDRRSMISGEYVVGQWGITGRVSAIQETPKSSLANDYMIRYNYDAESGDYAAAIRRNPGNSIACAISEDQSGKRVAPVIESVFIHDRGVAEYCVDWMCEHQTLPSYYVEYAADVWMMFKHTVGDNIKLTDERLGFDGVVSTIMKISYVGDHVVLGLAVWERYYTLAGGAMNFPEPSFDTSPETAEPQP